MFWLRYPQAIFKEIQVRYLRKLYIKFMEIYTFMLEEGDGWGNPICPV